ncbi:copper homeostasis protein CutC [Paenibacillus prosopidis]|uniref:PF03932 family protein CutC n=1 Tax=Paenibacillus prosopidis TaxID=630520 RepID=A0A368W197_9BACL|nr:copper homeostasis protein CutC [Paenibacillus prosopidis]RCW48108.1 copper homeostasis protein [Paenibacillus prosopidis]
MLLEVIATTADEAVTAAVHGADRIELISAFDQGGLTPNETITVAVLEALKRLETADDVRASKKVPIHAMMRPHSKSFVYDKADLSTMIAQIKHMRQLGVHAFVLGTLLPNGTIDEESLQRLLEAADERPVTFHRAFDEAADQEEALRVLLRFPQIKWVLTSGGKRSVLDAVERISRLIELSNPYGLTIMAGSGLTVPSLPQFVQATGVQAVHLGSGVRTGGSINGEIDAKLVRQARTYLDQPAS